MGFCGPLLAGANSSLLYWQPAAIEARGFYPSTLNLGPFLPLTSDRYYLSIRTLCHGLAGRLTTVFCILYSEYSVQSVRLVFSVA